MTPASRRARWWYSADEKRGFAWASVVGWDYRRAGSAGFDKSVLYVYLQSALLHLHGTEADSVYAEVVKLPKR